MVWVSHGIGGEVDRVDDTVISTRFARVNGMPVFPEDSFVQYQPEGADEPIFAKIPYHARSIVTGYLPRWSALAGAFTALGGAFVGCAGKPSTVEVASALVVGLALALAGRLLTARLARLSDEEKERRRIYGAWLGPAIDPVLCGAELDPWIDRLRGLVAQNARGSAASDYRSSRDTRRAWFDAALASDDVTFLGAAFTLARAEMVRTKDASALAELTAWHAKLWSLLSGRLAEAQAVPGVALLHDALALPGDPYIAPRSVLASPRVWIPLASAFVLGLLALGAYDYAHPYMIAINVTNRAHVVVLVDGVQVSRPIANADGGRGYEVVRIGSGSHTFEARDAATGEIVDRTSFHASWTRRGLVYTPARGPRRCVTWARVHYGNHVFDGIFWPAEKRVLDPNAMAAPLPALPDIILAAPPAQIQSNSNAFSETRTVLDIARCPTPPAGSP
ncbi:Hypothetical protein A7982_11198 [Minicystis rosea]|nr:Hypothetical protein A7982_11198 [Minicystis rosea]